MGDNTQRATVPGAQDQADNASKYTDLYDAFLDGATSGEHRKLKIVEKAGRTLLVAYNKWVYAEREKESGIITIYSAWRDADRVTNASNIQSGYLRQRIASMSWMNQMMLVEEDDESLVDVENNEYDHVQVDAPIA